MKPLSFGVFVLLGSNRWWRACCWKLGVIVLEGKQGLGGGTQGVLGHLECSSSVWWLHDGVHFVTICQATLWIGTLFCMDMILQWKLKTNQPSVALHPAVPGPAPPCSAHLASPAPALLASSHFPLHTHSAASHPCPWDVFALPSMIQAGGQVAPPPGSLP